MIRLLRRPRVAWAGMFGIIVLFAARPGRAETGEKSVGLEASVVMPGFSSEDSAAVALATWGLGGFVQYGLLEDLYAQARLSFGAFNGSTSYHQTYYDRPLDGQLHFSATQLHLELGGRYKLLSGYDVAPYVEAMGGVLWTTYRDQQFTNAAGQGFGVAIDNKGEGAVTLSIGLAADYRLMNMFFVGVALRYVQAFGGLYAHYISAPVQFSYYW